MQVHLYNIIITVFIILCSLTTLQWIGESYEESKNRRQSNLLFHQGGEQHTQNNYFGSEYGWPRPSNK